MSGFKNSIGPARSKSAQSNATDSAQLSVASQRFLSYAVTFQIPPEAQPPMKIEHVAFNVPDPLAMARWYVENLGFTVKRRIVDPPYAHFLADETGAVMIEIYHRTDAAVPDYGDAHPATLHLALVSKDVEQDVARLTAAGGTLDGQIDHTPAGDVMAFVRDPWNVCLQLVQRAEPMV